jgi:flagellar biosynthesis/type III secretory pathway protein FliH
MLLTEWNQDEAIEVAREEAWEEGREEGREEAQEEYRQYFLELLEQGLTVEEIKEKNKKKEGIFRSA